MSQTLLQVLASPYLLPTTSILSLTTALVIRYYVLKNGPIPIFSTIIKYNSRLYALFSLLLFLSISRSLTSHLSSLPTTSSTLHSTLCSHPNTHHDQTLRYIFHFSKIYEYIDIFNVLAIGGPVSPHFGFHHFTTSYLTFVRAIRYPTGWHVFGLLNTLHHALMYLYFGGAAFLSEVIVWTGVVQYAVMLGTELYLVVVNLGVGNVGECGGKEALWAYVVGLGLFVIYSVLFVGDLRGRGGKVKVRKRE